MEVSPSMEDILEDIKKKLKEANNQLKPGGGAPLEKTEGDVVTVKTAEQENKSIEDDANFDEVVLNKEAINDEEEVKSNIQKVKEDIASNAGLSLESDDFEDNTLPSPNIPQQEQTSNTVKTQNSTNNNVENNIKSTPITEKPAVKIELTEDDFEDLSQDTPEERSKMKNMTNKKPEELEINLQAKSTAPQTETIIDKEYIKSKQNIEQNPKTDVAEKNEALEEATEESHTEEATAQSEEWEEEIEDTEDVEESAEGEEYLDLTDEELDEIYANEILKTTDPSKTKIKNTEEVANNEEMEEVIEDEEEKHKESEELSSLEEEDETEEDKEESDLEYEESSDQQVSETNVKSAKVAQKAQASPIPNYKNHEVLSAKSGQSNLESSLVDKIANIIEEKLNSMKVKPYDYSEFESSAHFRSGYTVEDLAIEALNPILEKWIDKNQNLILDVVEKVTEKYISEALSKAIKK